MKSHIKRGRSPSPSLSEESNASSSFGTNAAQQSSSSSKRNVDTLCTPFEDRHIPSQPKTNKMLTSVSEILFQSNCEAALKEIEPGVVYTITKKEHQPPVTIFTASVSFRGKVFEAENTSETGAIARAAQLVLYYFMVHNDPALKRLNVAEGEANPYAQFTENPTYSFTLIKPGVKIHIIRETGTPPLQTFTARVVIDGSKTFEGVGPNPKAAQNEAARKALSFIISFGNRLRIYSVWNPNLVRESSPSATPRPTEHSVSDLIRLKPGTQINIIEAKGNPEKMTFTARVVVNGRSYYGTGSRKQEAKNEAARKAISSFDIKDQLKTKTQNIKEKIDELKKVKTELKGRLKSLKTQSKSNQKSSKDLVLKTDKPRELIGTKKDKSRSQQDKSKKLKKASKTAKKGRMDRKYLKELDAKNPTMDHKAVRKQRKTEKRKKNAHRESEPEKLEVREENPIKNLGADVQVDSTGPVDLDLAPGESSEEDPPFPEFGNHIAGMIESTFKSMKSADPSIPNHKILAGVVMTSGPKSKGCTLKSRGLLKVYLIGKPAVSRPSTST